jgi:hypothetical protein
MKNKLNFLNKFPKNYNGLYIVYGLYTFDNLLRLLLKNGFSHEESLSIILCNCSLSALVFQERIHNNAYRELSAKEALPPDYAACKEPLIYDLIIARVPRTFDGYLTEKSVVHDTLAKEFPDIVFEETNPDLDHAGDIDFIGKVGNRAFGLQIKPITAHASLGNFSVTARMEQSFRDFEKQFGGKVFIVFSVEDKIKNKEVIDHIRAEITRLKKK